MTTSALRHRAVHSARGVDARYEHVPLVTHDYEAFDAYRARHGVDKSVTPPDDKDALVEQQRELLVARAREKFDVSRPAHQQALVMLWSEANPELPFPDGRSSAKWGELGFQSNDPCSDLRGAGYLGLLQLTQFLISTGPSFRREVGSDFPLALASLSCTAMLSRYLGLDSTLIFPGWDTHHARPEVIRSFLLLQAEGAGAHDVLMLLHARLLRHLAWTWGRMQGPTTTIMDFHLALRSTYTHLHRALSATPTPWRLGVVTSMLERGRQRRRRRRRR